MKILQLCCFTNHWPNTYHVESHDITNGKDVMNLPDEYGRDFDFILAAPPCTQFTKANCTKWELIPGTNLKIANKCFDICRKSGKNFVLENPPGRIEKLIPGLTQFRQLTLNDIHTNKEWVLYSNMLLLKPFTPRYGRSSISNFGIKKRLAYPKYFINSQLPGLTESKSQLHK
jgi:hypothetical protein